MSTYVYGIVLDSHPAGVAELRGVGETPGPVRTVDADGLKAVVGDAPPDLRAKRRDLKAHQDVLAALIEQGPVLPMRFGLVAQDEQAVAGAVAARKDDYRAVLSELDGRVEMNVKVAHQQDAVLGALLRQDRELAGLNEQLRGRGGGTRDEQIRFGELVAGALTERQRRDSEALSAMLGEHAVRESSGPQVDGCFFNSSFLVDRDELDDFTSVVDHLRRTLDQVAEVRLRGPLPPYSFAGGNRD
ncbi:GvpL/GvpF family gas vesicle protein [Amycolatopsis sp. NPDC058986]|uniref:GvpL/GvpF family gas vesicle protein n=1 Tax=unclassified Amycolatopsis TaxID=2618356 RepID=UPI00366B2070